MTASHDSGRRLRVLMVMPSYYPVVGGMEIQIARQIPYLREHGIDAAILTRRPAGSPDFERHEGVAIRRISVPGGPGLRSISFTALGTLDIVKHRHEIDLIHAHSIMSPTTIAALSGTLLRKPRLVTLHQSYEPEHLLGKPFGKQRLDLFRRIIPRFISISSDIEQLLLAHDVPAARIVSIPNGIDTTTFKPAPVTERTELRRQLHLPEGVPIAVFVGRLQPVKQVDVLLEAWSSLTSGRLVILGDGDQRASLEAQATRLNLTDRVEFRGMVPNAVDFLRAADIFVLPSASEGLSVALLEAMASGLVPIATAIGGTTDLIRDGQTGLLVQSSDVAGLNAALCHALADADWRREVSEAARTFVVANYDMRVITAQLAGVYRDVVDATG
ncbi:MAG TPA: glycosyltransferase family 4 protein [Thermomicrobiales bacterium]|nr:glycosyltransferase family 4 protein [Thermomicrobiales bacterium]